MVEYARFDFKTDSRVLLQWARPQWSRYPNLDLPEPVGTHRFSAWPSKILTISPQSNVALPLGPFVRPDLPPIVDVPVATDEWIGIESRYTTGFYNGLIVFLPDYRARISRVHIGEQALKVDVEVEKALFDASKLVAKAALGYGGRYSASTVEFHEGSYVVPMPRLPQSFHFFLMERKTGQILDWAMIYPSWTDLPSEVEFALPGQQLEHVIEAGETDRVEFKQMVGDGFRLIQSLVAFANSEGGTIIVGVEDDGTITGTKPADDEEKIREWIEKRCDPPLAVSFTAAKIDDKELLSIQIPKGTNPPYQHRDNGIFYVRRGATDRPARRTEVDKFYQGGSTGIWR